MKKHIFLMALALFLGVSASHAQKKFSVYGVGFYNLENLFDTCHDAGKSDYEYLPDGTNRWTGLKYSSVWTIWRIKPNGTVWLKK